ncbi:ATP-binding protein [Leptospira congkakensis]|uniref:ATP-binding protein n=1 Tax=Leptospira congkakensis TaxID=2484932 RepID=A0A4Z1AAH3_9LEPT|nr:ATP-binding protein [Leptospira congkakensis]TGL86483.1 ATP-binding protein [Leptospira congkakensis]TGL93971.1 ATP-binding protein [Leptospira congkakensis]TGL94623.1 ATP-binding protein [Leptospira congkakensis]
MIINLPRHLVLETVPAIVESTISQNRNPISERFTFNFDTLHFIQPAGLTALTNIIEFLQKKNTQIDFKVDVNRAKFSNSVIKYLDDVSFFEKYLGNKLNIRSRIRDTTLTINIINIDSRFEWIDNTLIPWIKKQLTFPNTSNFETLRLCLMEIFNNISDHSQENIACLYAQHFPKWKQIQIAISDFGIGIPTNVKKKMHFDYDSYAIRKSVEEGFSTKSVPTNRGAGLDVLRKNIVENNGGSLTILSNRGKVRIFSDSTQMNQSNFHCADYELSEYPGTLLNLEINSEKFDDSESEEDFQWF